MLTYRWLVLVPVALGPAGSAWSGAGGPGLSGEAWAAEGDQVGAELGFSVATAGDVNGDGFDDVIVGAPRYDNGGRALVYLGTPDGPDASPAWTVGYDQIGALFGDSVATAGDVNGDGYGDVLVGASLYDGGQTDEGRAFLYLGSATGLAPSHAWAAESDQAGARFGASVAAAGDVNGDGFDDVIVGAPTLGQGQGVSGECRARLFLGSASGLSPAASWTAAGDQLFSGFGLSVAGAGDVDGDGFDDVLVGEPLYTHGEQGEGRALLFLGSALGLATAPAWAAEINVADAYFGRSVSSAGDVDADGYDDVIVGAPRYGHGQPTEGAAFLYRGSATGVAATPAWSAESEIYYGPNSGYPSFGASVAAAGDVDGDGYDDVVVGAPTHQTGQLPAGRAFLYLGAQGGLGAGPAWTAGIGGLAAARFGISVSTAGDTNGDGRDDVIVGAHHYMNPHLAEGGAFVYLGQAGPTPPAVFCAGDGSSTPCPCGNDGTFARGCANSTYLSGAFLYGIGETSVASDSLVLQASSTTGSTCVFFQGTAPMAPVAVDDGLGCISGAVIRLGTQPSSLGRSSCPQPGDLSLSVRGAVPPAGGMRYYQCFYRNAVAAYCPPATSNRTNGVVATWVP